MDEKQLQFLYNEYAKGKGFKDYSDFKGLMSSEGSRKLFFDDANKELGFKDYNEFNDLLGLKKKVGGEVSSPTKSQLVLPDFEKGKAFAEKGFLMQPEGTKPQKEIKTEPVEKQGLLLNIVSSLDKAFAKGFSSPVKALGTALQGATKKVMGGTGEGFISDPLIKFGDYLNNAIDELTPQDEEFKGTLTDQVAQAFGQVGSLVLTGGLTGAAGKGAALVSQAPKAGAVVTSAKTLGSQLATPTAVSAGLSMGQAEFDRAIEAGANDDQAFEAFYKNAAVGSVLETIPVMQFFKRFNNSTGGSVANYIKTKGVAGLTGGIEEMTTEVMEQLYANKTAKDIYNINQDILDGVGTSGGIGFGVGFLLNAMGANAKILRKQGREQEATILENQVKQYEDNIENPKVSSGNKISAKDIVTQGAEIGTQKSVQNLDRDLANGVITPEQHQEGIVFAEKAAQVADKIPETVTGESKVESVELLVERNDIKEANQILLQQKQTTDEAYHAGIDEEIKANEERIKKIDAEVYDIAKKPSKEFGTKKYIVDGEEVSKEAFEALQGKPLGTKTVIKGTEVKKSFTDAGEQSKKDQSPKALGDFIIDNSQVGDRIKINENEYYEVVARKERNGNTEVELQHFVKNEETGNFENNPSAVKIFTNKYRGTENEKLGYRDASDLFESSYTNSNGERVVEQSTYEPKEAEVKPTEVKVTKELKALEVEQADRMPAIYKTINIDAEIAKNNEIIKNGSPLDKSFARMANKDLLRAKSLGKKEYQSTEKPPKGYNLTTIGNKKYYTKQKEFKPKEEVKPTEVTETPKQEKKLGKSLISEEPIQGKGVVIATETGLTEQERLGKIAEREKQTKISDKVNIENALVQETKLFYEKNKRQRSSSEGLKKLNELRIRARELGLEIDDASESVVRKKGSRKTKIKYNSKADADSIIDKSAKTIYERRKDVQDVFKILNDNKNFLDFKTDLGVRMSDSQLDATIQDILDGVPSKRANRYLDEIQKAIDNDAFGLKDMGNNALTLEQIMESDRDINKIEKEFVGQPMDKKALEAWLNDQSNLTPEEEAIMIDDFENLLNEYEYENETRPEAEVSRVESATKERVVTKAEPTEINKKTTSIESKKEVTLQDIYERLPKSEKLKNEQVKEIVDKNFDSIIKQLEKYKIC